MQTLILTKNEVHTGNLILVNAKYPLVSPSHTELVAINEHTDILMERGAETVLSHILRNLSCTEEIVPVSGYRSESEQKEIYRTSLKENGIAFTKKYVATPNHSEHQTGLAIDLGLKKERIDFLCPDFPEDGICGEFRKKALHYGYIERYQRGKEAVTGIAYEPWHFRYVGYPHAEIMSEKRLSLEEYMDEIKKYCYDGEHLKVKTNQQIIEIFYVPCGSGERCSLSLPKNAVYQVSGNNVDGFVITLWGKCG